jgi:hypothetical protein
VLGLVLGPTISSGDVFCLHRITVPPRLGLGSRFRLGLGLRLELKSGLRFGLRLGSGLGLRRVRSVRRW